MVSSSLVMLATLLASTKPALAGIDIMVLAKPQVVNGEGDTTDDTRYTYRCLSDEFKCRDQELCVKATAVCDGIPDCHDRSDEEGCTRNGAGNFSQNLRYEKCEDHLFKCVYDDPIKCINPHWVCDGRPDCVDGFDEMNCTHPLPMLPIATQISGMSDRDLLPPPQNFCNSSSEFKCKDGLCIPAENICDDISDCLDRSDEEREMCAARPCTDEQFTCIADKVCIPVRWRCDGSPDCKDGSDEFHCGLEDGKPGSIECGLGMFHCGDPTNSTEKCIDLKKVCDGSEDCEDGRDESSANCTTSCESHRCQSDCQMMPDGTDGFCTCPLGFQLNEDGLHCNDVDECQEYAKCSQICNNHVGSFECSCAEGYFMSGLSCKASGNVDATLFFSGKTEIRGLNLRTNNDFVVTRNKNWTNAAIGIAYDARDDRVFWTATENQKSRIVSSSRDGDKFEEVVSGLVMPESLAVDYVARNIYFSEPPKDYLGVCNLDAVNGSRWCLQLHYAGVNQPREIALHIPRGILFFTDWAHAMAAIVRVGMDGTQPTTIVKENLHWPNGITVDAVAERVYWSDAKHDLLESSKFDGTDRRQTEVNVIRHPFSLAVFEDRLFWSDWDLKKIQSCHKVTGQQREFLFNDTKIEPFGIHVYHPILEPVLDNPCKGRPCSHLCLMAHGGSTFTCKCPDGLVLGIDERTCVFLMKPTTAAPEKGTVVAPAFAPTMTKEMQAQRLKLGMAVGIVLCLILCGFVLACYLSYRRKDTKLPLLRYFKNQPFGLPTHRDRGDKEDIVTTISQDENAFIAFRNACSTESRETSPQLDTDQTENDQTDKGAKNSPNQGLKLWRPNMASSNSYRRF